MDYSSMQFGKGMPISWHENDEYNECNIMSKIYNGLENRDRGKKFKPVCTIKGHTNDVTSLDFTGRNLLATGSSDKTVRLYKWLPGNIFEEVAHSPLKGHRYGINCVTFSPFGTKLASASTDGLTIIWDVKTGDNLCSLQPSGKTAGVRTCAFSPNSSLLATGGDDDLAAVWDVSTLLLMRQMSGHEATITCVAFTPDSCYLATGSSSGEFRLWDGMYGHAVPLVIKAEVHDLGISCLHFSPTIGKEESMYLGKQFLLATGGQDTDLHLWVVYVGSKKLGGNSKFGETRTATISLHNTLCGHKAPIMTVKFSPNGMLLASTSGDKTVRLWDVGKLQPIAVLEGHKRYVTSCAFSDDGVLLAAGGGDRVTHIWKVDEITKINIFTNAGGNSSRKLNRFSNHLFRENKKLVSWTTEEVCEWLGEQGLAEYTPNFRTHAINGREMINLTEDVLESKLGVDALGHRNKIIRLIRLYTSENSPSSLSGASNAPADFLCPITQELMKDPVLCADGFSYEREAVEAWLASGKRTSPMTNEKLFHLMLTPNRTLRNLIQRHTEEST